MNISTVYRLSLKIYSYLSNKRKNQAKILIILTFLASFAEMLSLGAAIPFFLIIGKPEVANENYINIIMSHLKLINADNSIIILTAIFIITILVAGLLRMYLLKYQTYFGVNIGIELSEMVFSNSLDRDYLYHTVKNKSILISGVNKAIELIDKFIRPGILLLSSVLIFSTIFATVVFIEPIISLVIFISVAVIYYVLVKITKKFISLNSRAYAKLHSDVYKILQEGFGGIRELILTENKNNYLKRFSNCLRPMQHAYASNTVIGSYPRSIVEVFATIVLAVIGYLMIIGDEGEHREILPILGVVVFSLQRLLPVCQQIYSSYINIQGSAHIAKDVIDLLDCKEIKIAQNQSITYNHSISLKNLSFFYPDTKKLIISNLNLFLKKGEKVGIIGKNGSGKSTLLDIMVGLLPSSDGVILVDGKPLTNDNLLSWRNKISYVSQFPYFNDDSIIGNIICNNDLNVEKLNFVIGICQIQDLITQLPEGLNTSMGDSGVRFSGGQRQKIGIARALYGDKDIIIFDESTSALDSDTEILIMDSVLKYFQNTTIIMVTHKYKILRGFSSVFSLKDGALSVFCDSSLWDYQCL